MVSHQITAVRKLHRASSTEHITHVRYDGFVWPRERVIKLIEARTDSFYVQKGWDKAWVEVVYPHMPRRPFLRTYPDGKWDDNLLSLHSC